MAELPEIPLARKETFWTPQRMTYAGVAGVALVALLFALPGDSAREVSLPEDLDTEMGLREIDGDSGGLSPGGVIGSRFAIASGSQEEIDKAEAALPVKKDGTTDWNAVLRNISKKKRRTKKARGPIGVLKAMLAKWGGGSGGSGSGMRLSALSSKGLIKRRRPGAGQLARITGTKRFRGAYSDGSGVSKSNSKASSKSLFASAATKVRGMFGGNKASGFKSGNNKDVFLSDNSAGTGVGDAPGVPDAGEGKPVEKKADSKDSDDDDDEKKKAEEDLLDKAMSGASSGFKPNWGSNSKGAGKGGGIVIQTGVSKRGFLGDAESGTKLGKNLTSAESGLSPGSMSEAPKFKADGDLSQAQTNLAQVQQTRPYDPSGVDTALGVADAAPAVPETSSGPELMTGVDPKMFEKVNTTPDRAISLAEQAQDAVLVAREKGEAFRTAITESSTLLRARSQDASSFSESIVTQVQQMESTTRVLEEGKPKFDKLGTVWEAANAREDFNDMAYQNGVAVGYQRNYGNRARADAESAQDLYSASQQYRRFATEDQARVKTDLQTAGQAYAQAVADLDTKTAALGAELKKLSGSTAGLEGAGTSLTTMRSNADEILAALNSSRGALHGNYNTYSGLATDLNDVGTALTGVWSGSGKTPS